MAEKSQVKQQTILNKNGDKRGMNPNSQKNILPNINRNGRPTKEKSITALIRDMLDQEAGFIAPGASPDDKTWGQLIAKAILYNAAKGNPQMIKELLDRLEGKVTQPIGGEDGQPIKTEIIVSSETAKQLTKAILNGEGT